MPSVAIVTRNAVHGGVETMIAMHQQFFDAAVFVAGGSNHPETCPFHYTYIDGTNPAPAQMRLARLLRAYDIVIYHWLPSWAQESVRWADRPAIEVVHRDDTADNDKCIPDFVVTHSQFLADFLQQQYSISAAVIPHAVDVTRYPSSPSGSCVGAITSYYKNKGIDLLIEAWAQLEAQFPQHRLRLYGAGKDREMFETLASNLDLRAIDLLGPVPDSALHYDEFCLVVQPSRAEGMPFAIVEALASNVPVIASNLPAMVEFNQLAEQRRFPAPLTLFQAGDSADLREKIAQRLLKHDRQEQSRDYIARFYGPDQHRQAYSQAMEQAIALHTVRIAQERRWQGWRRPPRQMAGNLYRMVVPRRLRRTAWAYRHRPSIPR